MAKKKKNHAKVDGLKQLKKDLKEAGRDVKQLKEPNLAAANIVCEVAAKLAPLGDTGRLRRNIRTGATMKAGMIRAGGARVPYAAPIHWGWKKKTYKRKNIKATYFSVRAAAMTEPEWSGEYEYHLNQIIRDLHNGG